MFRKCYLCSGRSKMKEKIKNQKIDFWTFFTPNVIKSLIKSLKNAINQTLKHENALKTLKTVFKKCWVCEEKLKITTLHQTLSDTVCV